MFTTLVESRAGRRRSVRGAVLSVVVHTLVIAAAVALTIPTRVDARPHDAVRPPVIFVPAPPAPSAITHAPASTPTTPIPPRAPVLSIAVPMTVPTSLPPIDFAAPTVPAENIVIGVGGLLTGRPGLSGPEQPAPGGVLAAEVVDRVPRIVGSAQPPRYPDALRQSGATGQVIVRFVVDTLGRAELADLTVVEATHPLFASAVKNALLGYRFTPGEAAGRKVRTLVQVPFSFTLK